MSTPHAAARSQPIGWYSHPHDPTIERWWDGSGWSPDTRRRGASQGHSYPPNGSHPAATPPYFAQAPAFGVVALPAPGVAISALVCGILGVLILPFIFGVLAIIFGAIAPKHADGKW